MRDDDSRVEVPPNPGDERLEGGVLGEVLRIDQIPESLGHLARRTCVAEGAGVSLFVREIGSGPPVVVLHGGPGAHHDYLLPGFGPLGDEFRLHWYDQRGGGRSRIPRPAGVHWRDHVRDLEALRAWWGHDRLTLLGYSWGGLLALLYGLEFPERVKRLALVAPAAPCGEHHERFREELARRSISSEVQKLHRELEASGLRRRDPAAYRQRRFDISVAGYYRDPRRARDAARFVVQAQTQRATWESLRSDDPRLAMRLPGLHVPVLILHGRHDPMPFAWAEELTRLLPDARLVPLEDSGHVPQAEDPERTLAELRGFLRERATA